MNEPAQPREPDFSLVLGGPLYQMFRRAHLSGPTLELLKTRLIVIILFTWLPLAVLSALNGHFIGPGLSFLRDAGVHTKFLAALPALILAEVLIHARGRTVLKSFLE